MYNFFDVVGGKRKEIDFFEFNEFFFLVEILI